MRALPLWLCKHSLNWTRYWNSSQEKGKPSHCILSAIQEGKFRNAKVEPEKKGSTPAAGTVLVLCLTGMPSCPTGGGGSRQCWEEKRGRRPASSRDSPARRLTLVSASDVHSHSAASPKTQNPPTPPAFRARIQQRPAFPTPAAQPGSWHHTPAARTP